MVSVTTGWSSKYLSIVALASGEESLHGIVARNEKSGEVDEELASDVEEDQEEIEAEQTEEHVDLGDGGLALEVIENRVLR